MSHDTLMCWTIISTCSKVVTDLKGSIMLYVQIIDAKSDSLEIERANITFKEQRRGMIA